MEYTKKSTPDAKARGSYGKPGCGHLILRFPFYLSAIALLVFFSSLTYFVRPLAAEDRPESGDGQIPQAALSPTAREGAVAEVAAGKPEGGETFGHNLVFAANPGLPSYLLFSFAGQKPKFVRAILIIDHELLVVPLRFREQSGDFRGEFPTPEQSLEYQFQAGFADGSTLLSESFIANPSCAFEEARNFVAAARKYPGQSDLLQQALDLDGDIAQLRYIVSALGSMGQEQK